MKITQGIGKKIACHYVVCGALKTTTGTFAPVFKIHKGDTSFGELVHVQEFPATSANFASEEEAFNAGAELAAAWLAAQE